MAEDPLMNMEDDVGEDPSLIMEAPELTAEEVRNLQRIMRQQRGRRPFMQLSREAEDWFFRSELVAID